MPASGRTLLDRLRRGPFRELSRAVSWHRRLVAAGLAAAAVALGLTALEPDPPPSSTVQTAARDLPAGTRLDAGDLRPVDFPDDAVPAGSAASATGLVGRVLAAPVRRGEPLTDRRVLGRALLAAYGERLVAAPVRVADPGVLEFVRVGSRVDVLAAENTGDGAYGAAARALVRDAPVVALPRRSDPSGDSSLGGLSAAVPEGGGLVVLAVPAPTAAELGGAAVTSQLSLALRE